MSTYETTYCNTTTDLLFVEPNLAQYDGKRVIPMATSQDHKRVYDGDNGKFSGYGSPEGE